MKRLGAGWAVWVAAAVPCAGAGDRLLEFEFSAGPGVSSGDVTYEIGRSVVQDGVVERAPFPISRLEWPIDVLTAEFDAGLRIARRFELRARFAMSLTEDAGTMIDSDWNYPEGNQLLTIYSESDAVLDAWTLDLSARWWAWRQTRPGDQELRLGLGAGWLRQDFAWEARDGTQSYPSEPGVAADTWEGTAITYDIAADLPYLELCGSIRQPKVVLDGRVAWIPSASVKDRDDHQFRDILANTDADGMGLIAEAAIRYDLTERVFLRFRAQYVIFVVDGPSENRVYGAEGGEEPVGTTWRIDEEIRSAQAWFSFGIGLNL